VIEASRLGERVGFNCASFCEVSPDKLHDIHEAPKMNAMVIEVARVK